jgi:plasmid stability protein
MKALTIRNIPDDLHRVITRLAQRNRRSIQQQVLTILERARILDIQPPSDRAKEIRNRLDGRKLGNIVNDIRKERNR